MKRISSDDWSVTQKRHNHQFTEEKLTDHEIICRALRGETTYGQKPSFMLLEGKALEKKIHNPNTCPKCIQTKSFYSKREPDLCNLEQLD